MRGQIEALRAFGIEHGHQPDGVAKEKQLLRTVYQQQKHAGQIVDIIKKSRTARREAAQSVQNSFFIRFAGDRVIGVAQQTELDLFPPG